MRVTVNPGPGEATLDRPVRVVWPGMPASLRNVDYALGALRYIAPPALLDSLASGSFEERRDNLEGFWREKDPENKTPYNPFMIQYYQRVDYAAANFGTLRNPDGLGTDRAKVYILYGPPSRSERSLDPAGANRETWTYDRLKRTFVFEDPLKNGTYVLRPGQ
jgi:GWxTD domain-containing protein